MSSAVVTALRGCILAGLLLGLIGQVLVVPILASEQAQIWPEVAGLAVPYATAAILVIVCVQVVLVAVWRLLGLVRQARIFTDRALRPVDVVIVSLVVAMAICAAVVAHMTALGIAGPFLFLGVPFLLGGGGGVVLVVIVLRRLLGDATRLDGELQAVV